MSAARPSAADNCAFVRELLWSKYPLHALEIEVLAEAAASEATDLAWPTALAAAV